MTFVTANGGVITSSEARRLGLDGNALRSLVRSGSLRRVARGAYICRETEASADPQARHRLLTTAVVRAYSGRVAASHHSAAVLHGLPVLAEDLSRVHVTHTRPTTESTRHGSVSVHRWPGEDTITAVGALPVVVPAAAVVGTAVVSGVRSGIAVADAALRRRLTTKAELADRLERMRHTPGLAVARHVVQQACPSAESPAESWARLVLIGLGYRVVPQFRITDEHGLVVARVDFYLPDLGVVVEVDGLLKYDGESGRAALVREKAREDRIRRRGYGMARLVWADLARPERVRAIVEQAARTATVGG